MRGTLQEYCKSEFTRNTSQCVTVDNIFNHNWHESKQLYKSVGMWFTSEKEFEKAKEEYRESSA